MSPGIRVIVTLKYHIDGVFVKDGFPRFALVFIGAASRRKDGVMECDKGPFIGVIFEHLFQPGDLFFVAFIGIE